MAAQLCADAFVLLHLGFIVFVALGGLIVLRWPRLAWAHLPAVAWGVLIEFTGWICPLTPLENRLRTAAGVPAYSGDFIDRYLVPIVYPVGLTRNMQLTLAAAVIVVNLGFYGRILNRLKIQRFHEE